jgi:ribosome biogenesis GTPase / thiamine phosphate phosphatase
MGNNKKDKKFRADFRKKHQSRSRRSDLTRGFAAGDQELEESPLSERVSGKGDLTRKRTVTGDAISEQESGGLTVQLGIDQANCLTGRVTSVHGLTSFVQTDQGQVYRCATRQVLKSLNTDQRHVVAAGDRVWFRPEPSRDGVNEGIIERIESRHGVLSRTSKGRRHVLVANVDQLLIVTSAAQPTLKPNLIDRMLVTAEKNQIRPVICINKVDLVDPADLQPLSGVFGQMGYEILMLSAVTGLGLERLRRCVAGRQSVVAGQSGVGKSSLLNAIEPGLNLRVQTVSEENQKGRHTTSAAQLLPLSGGGFIVDTPGIRQFQLWDVIPEEVAGFYRDLRPYVSRCRFPDCTHTHESDCAVKDAVADGRLDARRFESYCQLRTDGLPPG